MTPEQWNRLKTVFQEALDQPPAGRRAWLERACAGDDSLLREAGALLETYDTAGDFLDQPAQIDPADLETLLPGTKVGAYEIVEEIGRGGMGVVYLARDVRLGRHVALKSLPPSVAANAELRERLVREARAAATISHPSVATVHALEELDDQLFIVSEYVRGETLRSEIARGPIAPARARAIAADVARALCAAHEAGVVHRDLKPENVIVTPAGGIKVVDFGIAYVEGPESARLTRTGAMLGTPAYMAPEQLLGVGADSRVDIYAFGVVLSEMLTGRHPAAERGRESPGDLEPLARSTYVALIEIARRCMQPESAARYATAVDLLTELEALSRQRNGVSESRSDEGGSRRTGVPQAGRAPHTSAGNVDLADHPTPAQTARWWWEFHQAVAAVVYWAMVVPAWRARDLIGGAWGRTFFIVLLAGVIVAANLRLHLWFTSRFYPAELRWVRRRTGRWIRLADWIFALTLASATLLISDDKSPLPAVLLSVAIGAAVAFLVIEPVTTRAAFKSSTG